MRRAWPGSLAGWITACLTVFAFRGSVEHIFHGIEKFGCFVDALRRPEAPAGTPSTAAWGAGQLGIGHGAGEHRAPLPPARQRSQPAARWLKGAASASPARCRTQRRTASKPGSGARARNGTGALGRAAYLGALLVVLFQGLVGFDNQILRRFRLDTLRARTTNVARQEQRCVSAQGAGAGLLEELPACTAAPPSSEMCSPKASRINTFKVAMAAGDGETDPAARRGTAKRRSRWSAGTRWGGWGRPGVPEAGRLPGPRAAGAAQAVGCGACASLAGHERDQTRPPSSRT